MNDLISKQVAVDALGERPVVWNEWTDEYNLGQRNQYDADRLAIETVPTIDPVKHGKWELVDEAELRRYGCSECKRLSYTQDNYCSYCGARMDGVEKIGHWVDHIKDFWCSECGGRIQKEQAKMFLICPYCGARME